MRNSQITYFYQVGSKYCLSGAPVFIDRAFWKSPGISLRWPLWGFLVSAVWALADPVLSTPARLKRLHWFSLVFLLGTLNFRFLDRYGFIVNPFAKHTIINTHRCTFRHRNSNTHTCAHTHTRSNTHKQAGRSRVCAYNVYAHKHGLVKV